MTNCFVVTSTPGPNRDLSKGSRDQAFWDDHAAFMDALVDEGFILLGGPFDDGGAMLVVRAKSETAVREKLEPDPWYQRGLLKLESIRHWEIFINEPHP